MAKAAGLLLSDEELPFTMQHYYTGGPGNVPNYSDVYYTIGTFQMPWDGQLFATFTAVYSWTGGHQHVQAALLGCTPGVSDYSIFNAISTKAGGTRGSIPMQAVWSSLAKNQVVTIVARCGTGNGGIVVNFENIAGSVRATR